MSCVGSKPREAVVLKLCFLEINVYVSYSVVTITDSKQQQSTTYSWKQSDKYDLVVLKPRV